MSRRAKSQSPNSEAVIEYYASGFEAARLHDDAGKIEGERSRELLKRFLPPAPATVLDVGGGPGGYACWLAEQGYTVHLIDLSPLHVQLAEEASRSRPDTPLASASVGDACALSWEAGPVDAVLLLGAEKPAPADARGITMNAGNQAIAAHSSVSLQASLG